MGTAMFGGSNNFLVLANNSNDKNHAQFFISQKVMDSAGLSDESMLKNDNISERLSNNLNVSNHDTFHLRRELKDFTEDKRDSMNTDDISLNSKNSLLVKSVS